MDLHNLHDVWVSAGPTCGAPDGEFSKPTHYLKYYQEEFASLRDSALTIVEIGVFRGQFLETLGRYFPKAKIVGIDFQPERATFSSQNAPCSGGIRETQVNLTLCLQRTFRKGLTLSLMTRATLVS